MSPNGTRLPIAGVIFLSSGGWLLHMRVHPVSFDPASPSDPAYLVPFFAGIMSIIITPILLAFAKTFVVGYLLNGMSVVIGTITMASLSLAHPPAPLTFPSIFLGTMLSSIVLLFPKLFLGQMILFHYHPKGMGRLFTAFWWIRHFIYLSVIFALGHVIGR